MKYGCIGEHLSHSFSAEIHRELDSHPYDIYEVAREALGHFMTERDFSAINVTIPYKGDVMPYLAWISERAKDIGAVNTIVNRGGELYGYNTDFSGMRDLIARTGVTVKGKKIAILGTGGTSRTALAVAKDGGARSILRVSRHEGEGLVTYDELYAHHTDVEIMINTTPVGMYPHSHEAPVRLADFSHVEGVIDAIYNPLRPQLVLDAKRRGIPSSGGLYMLVAQAVRASEIFLDCTYSEGTSERIYRRIRAQKENIVLSGMPASGKSTVGRVLAASLEREFLDLDDEIVRVAGKSIPEIFERDGEAFFRALETRVLKEKLSDRTGIVLASGGGAILKDENVDLFRRNGRIYFLDRPLELLLPTADRPLASSREAITRRYEERYDRYLATADVRMDGSGSPEAVANAIRKEFETR